MAGAVRDNHRRLRKSEDKVAAANASVLPLDGMRGKHTPYKLDDPQARGILLGAAAFMTVEHAAALAGVAPSSVYDLRKRDPEFESQWQTAKARMIGGVEMCLQVVATSPTNPRCVEAAKVILQAHRPEVYRQRQEIEITTPLEQIEMVKAAAALVRQRRKLSAVTVEVAPGGNGHGDSTAIEKLVPGGNGDGRP